MEEQDRLAVVILNYEAYWETEKCIESILERNMDVMGIVVVDNGSGNESFSYLRRKYQNNKQVRLLRSGKNLGFAKGNNLGIRAARETWGAEFILLLNSDTVMIEEEYFVKIMTGYQPGVGVIQTSVLRLNGRYTQKNYGAYSLSGLLTDTLERFCFCYNIYFTWKGKMIQKHRLGPWVSGCDMLLTPDFFRIFKGLYPLTFLYGEEHILAMMLKKAGLEWKIVEDAHILHAESKSTPDDLKEGTWKKRKMMLSADRNKLIVRILPLKILCWITNGEKGKA